MKSFWTKGMIAWWLMLYWGYMAYTLHFEFTRNMGNHPRLDTLPIYIAAWHVTYMGMAISTSLNYVAVRWFFRKRRGKANNSSEISK